MCNRVEPTCDHSVCLNELFPMLESCNSFLILFFKFLQCTIKQSLYAFFFQVSRVSIMQPAFQTLTEHLMAFKRGISQSTLYERTQTRTACYQSLKLKRAIGLKDRIRINRQFRHNLTH